MSPRYEHFQNSDFVTIAVYIKKADPAAVAVEITAANVTLTVRLATESTFSLDLDLLHDIDPASSRFTILSSQIEIKLKKLQPVHWTSLETTDAPAPLAPQSKKNWDKLATEIIAGGEKEEEGVNNLFQKIFAGGDENTRKAMMKSFSESGGTCLSTNWDDIGSKRTEITPPEGMEARKYN